MPPPFSLPPLTPPYKGGEKSLHTHDKGTGWGAGPFLQRRGKGEGLSLPFVRGGKVG